MDTGFGEKYEYLKCTFNPLVASSNLARPTKYSNLFKTPQSLLCGVFSCLPRLLSFKLQASSFKLQASSFKLQDRVFPIPLTKPAIELPTLQGPC